MSKKLSDCAILAFFVVLAVLLYSSTADYTGIAQKTSAKYVQFLAVSLGILSLVQFAFSLVKRETGEKLVIADHAVRFFGLLAALIIFAFVFETLGFFLSAAIFIPLVAVLLGYRSWLTLFLSTGGVILFVYLIFEQLLSVNLPGINF